MVAGLRTLILSVSSSLESTQWCEKATCCSGLSALKIMSEDAMHTKRN